MQQTVYDFSALDFNMNKVSLSDYKGKVLLIVNTASKCFFSKQFKSLESLYKKYKDQGFEILAFPSHSFGNQEPLTGRTLEIYCRVNQQVTFPVFKRIHVIGEYTDPLYRFLSDRKQNGAVNAAPKWNFHKYLINRQGGVEDFYYSTTSPLSGKIRNKIEALLSESP